MKKNILFGLFLTILSASNSWAMPAGGGNGGNIFDKDEKEIETFDEIEWSEGINIKNLSLFKEQLLPTLNSLFIKVPHFTNLLAHHLFQGGTTWHFVNASLKKMPIAGDSHVVIPLSWERKQIAINKQRRVQIQKDLFERLPNDLSKSYVFWHEVYHSLVFPFPKENSSEKARAFAGLMTSEALKNFSKDGVHEQFRSLIPLGTTAGLALAKDAIFGQDPVKKGSLEEFINTTDHDTQSTTYPYKARGWVFTQHVEYSMDLAYRLIYRDLDGENGYRFETRFVRYDRKQNSAEVSSERIVTQSIGYFNKKAKLVGANQIYLFDSTNFHRSKNLPDYPSNQLRVPKFFDYSQVFGPSRYLVLSGLAESLMTRSYFDCRYDENDQGAQKQFLLFHNAINLLKDSKKDHNSEGNYLKGFVKHALNSVRIEQQKDSSKTIAISLNTTGDLVIEYDAIQKNTFFEDHEIAQFLKDSVENGDLRLK